MVVLHYLPGRIRAKDSLLYDKDLSRSIEIYCENLYGVKFSRVNHHSATVLIVYDEEKTNRSLILENVEAAIHTPPACGLRFPLRSCGKARRVCWSFG